LTHSTIPRCFWLWFLDVCLHEYQEHLGISSDYLEGTIPTELALLPRLTTLHLINLLYLYGGLPSQFVNLSSLSEIIMIDAFDDTISFTQMLSCLPSKSLASFEIMNSGLAGTIPPNISSFQSLTLLSLKSVKITGSIPTEIGLMTNLKRLELEGLALSFTSSIPSEIGLLTNLQLLNLARNELEFNTLPTEITQISNLMIIPLNSW
jgi:Leucine-rich repeat (LRR) protein